MSQDAVHILNVATNVGSTLKEKRPGLEAESVQQISCLASGKERGGKANLERILAWTKAM